MSTPRVEQLWLYGEPSSYDTLDWSAVDRQLAVTGVYWVVPRPDAHPHPRPVWGVWSASELHLSIGSRVLIRQLATDARVTVHLGDGTEVVILEGVAEPEPVPDDDLLAAYAAKYGQAYDLIEYGPLTRVRPAVVDAWHSVGPDGRDGFRATARFRFDR